VRVGLHEGALVPRPLRHRVLKENLVVVVAALVCEDTVGDGEKVLAVSPAGRGTETDAVDAAAPVPARCTVDTSDEDWASMPSSVIAVPSRIAI
jgi:hypothetical protein